MVLEMHIMLEDCFWTQKKLFLKFLKYSIRFFALFFIMLINWQIK